MRAALLLLAASCAWSAVEVRLAMVTAYTPSLEGGGAGTGLTSTGERTDDRPHGIAADPRLLPYGTIVIVPGYRDTQEKGGPGWPVDDTGAALRRDTAIGVLHLDLRMRSVRSAREWGVRWLMVTVWRLGD